MLSKIFKAIQTILSKDNRLDIRNIRYLPRWMVLFIDTFLVILSAILTYGILIDLKITPLKLISPWFQLILIFGVYFFYLIIFRTYAGLIRHSSYLDALKLFLASASTFFSLLAINVIGALFLDNKIFLNSGLVLFLFVSFTALFLFRLTIKQLYEFFKIAQKDHDLINAYVLGIDDSAISIAAALDMEHPQRFKVVGFLSKKENKRLLIIGKPVLEIKADTISILKSQQVKAVIFAGNSLTAEEKYTIVEDCLENNIKIFNSPLVINWSDKTSVTNQLKTLQIEDLLDREPIVINNKSKSDKLLNKTILVTGGAGSIGSEIVRQVGSYSPKKILVLDQAETPLHNLSLELQTNFPKIEFEFIICDVANRNRLGIIFEKNTIDIIYHAAAYKHVPLMEENPTEAVLTNIYGTKNLTDLAVIYAVGHFVMVSTDKAVNPTNVMGASKRAAELYVQSRFYYEQKRKRNSPKFITTRFGNVLGSNGSVVPLFKKQIERGGPVTITHPDIIRYFMTIPEACQLVLEAGAMGKGGEIYIFDMGEPVRIMDLAEKMIKLAGFVPNVDIQIKITGLRPGEKLFEELLSDKSKTIKTHHHKIMISQDLNDDFERVNNEINEIIKSALKFKNKKTVASLKKLVPEFKSQNSEYESLDISKTLDEGISES